MRRKISTILKRGITIGIAALSCMALVLLSACSGGGEEVQKSESNPIQSITAIGMVDYDGVKLKAMALEYAQDLTGSDVSADTFEISVFTSIRCDYQGNGNLGDITKVYVNDEIATSDDGGSGSGRYVIIEVFTDYTSATNLLYTRTMTARAKQVKDIRLADGTVIAAYDEFANNVSGATTTSYSFVIPEIEGFQYYTNNPGEYGADGPAWTVKNCFNQQDGKYYDVDVSYAIYLPEGYNEQGNYAMVTLQNPAASAGTHPKAAILTYRSAAVYASEEMQNVVKANGLDGLIVLVPVVTQRVNDNGGTPAEYEAIVNLWDHVIETYHVDPDYVYGSGQSVGGMILLETNRNRDNFFAGLLLYDDQWAQNYYIDTIFARDMVASAVTADSAEMHYPRTNSNITWNYSIGTDGEKVYDGHDPYNYYYLVSDDNILVLNCTDNNLSNDAWSEMKYLYYDLTGYDGLQHLVIDAADDLATQNESLKNYLNRENELNINWVSLENSTEGFHNRKLEESYKWLLSQSRKDEVAREKLDLNKPFALADEQIVEGRETHFTNTDGSTVYYVTAKSGAGTRFYNSGWFNTNVIADAAPGWLPEGLSWTTGVQAANVRSVTAIGTTAVAIGFDADMQGLIARLTGDKVYNHVSGEYRDDDLIALDPFEFYDSDGNKLDCAIKNIYLNDTAAVRTEAERGSGSGCYIIVEFSASLSKTPSKMIQRTTIYATNGYLISAYPWTYDVA